MSHSEFNPDTPSPEYDKSPLSPNTGGYSLSQMRTNIERAINELIISKTPITLENALPAYFREAGFREISHDALISFEHALDKYPTLTDESRTVFLSSVSCIMSEYWSDKCSLRCPHCTCKLNVRANPKTLEAPQHHQQKETKETTKRRLKSKKARRIRQKRNAPLRFDPFAPSTSAVTL